MGRVVSLAACLAWGGLAHDAAAQSVVQTREPNVLLLLDTSGSMAWAYDGSRIGDADCDDSGSGQDCTCSDVGKKTRWAILAEVLTGTLPDLECGRVRKGPDPDVWVPLSSNGCVPGVNQQNQIAAALDTEPRAWPLRPGAGLADIDRHPVVFHDDYGCAGASGADCENVPSGIGHMCDASEWNQQPDGLIDTFAGSVRFGLMTFDNYRVTTPWHCGALDVPDALTVDETGGVNTHPPRFPAFDPTGPFHPIPLWRQHALGGGIAPAQGGDGDEWPESHYAGKYFPLKWSYWFQDDTHNFTTGTTSYTTPLQASSSGCYVKWAPSCSPSCPAGFTCNAFANRCERACDASGACPANYACNTQTNDCERTTTGCSAAMGGGAAGGFASGDRCFRRCSTDAQCPSGFECDDVQPGPGFLGACRGTAALDVDGDYELGARNSNAPPWMGRLMGFDPATGETVGQRRDHNEMVQLATLASGPYGGSTPLAGMMRDAKEFIIEDTASRGAYLPNQSALPLISPQADPSFTDAAQCRQTHIILITDGEPSRDLDARASVYAADLAAEGVRTYVVGVGLSTARWDRDESGALDGAETTPTACADLVAEDLDAGHICATAVVSGRPRWRYADVDPMGDALTSGERSALRACCTLLDIAVKGGTDRAYFPDNQSELKSSLGNFLAEIAGGTISRTVPVFAPVIPAGTSATDAPATFLELRSSISVPVGSGMWSGHLERVRYACDAASFEPVREAIDADLGDVFEANLEATAARPRRFFTVVPDHHDDFAGSLRVNTPSDPDASDGANTEGFTRLGGGTTDDLVEMPALPAAMEAIGPDLEDVMGLTGVDGALCDELLGDSDRRECARRALRWHGADDSDVFPTPPRLSTSCPTCSPLGAVYRSNPIVVQPPAPDVADQTYANERASASTPPSFVEEYGLRPTMLYAQSVDGQLHAFTLAKNVFTGTSPFHTQVPEVDERANNELWTFLPPITIPALWDGFNSHALLTDGPITADHVVFRRTATQLAQGTSEWRTVIVASGGASQLGGFYYAVDVTDPLEPRFLWQLSTSGNQPLFADRVPGAAITHLSVENASGEAELVAVAVLSGGQPPSLPSDVENRREAPSGYWEGVENEPRGRIRDWGNAEVSRTLTIVELATGRIIARLGRNQDHPASLDGDVTVDAPFDSPLSSTPVAFPFGAGEPATRLYVGDVDGTLWRVSVASADPDDWTTQIAWDAYNHDSSTNALEDAWVAAGPGAGAALGMAGVVADVAALMGRPVQTPPLVAFDDLGSPVVMFSTGDLETFGIVSTGDVNMLVSFTDAFADSGDFSPRIATGPSPGGLPLRGLQLAFRDGGRVTGPLTLYDGGLIFSYFVPSDVATGSCRSGGGGACAMVFNERDGTGRPREFLDLDASGGATDDDLCVGFDDEVVFGLAINQVPSCVTSEQEFEDPWLAGRYKAQTASNAPGYQLVMHTGEGGAIEEADSDGQTRTLRIGLPRPRSQASVISWVSALE